MDYSQAELIEAKRQIASVLHKTKEVEKTFAAKENADRFKSQITLATRRIEAFEIALALIEEELAVSTDVREMPDAKRDDLA